MMHVVKRERYSGSDLRQCYSITEYPVYDHVDGTTRWNYDDATVREVLIGLNNLKLRLRYPYGSNSKVQYLPDATTELKSLAVLCIAGLVPTSIFADALQEAYPQHEQAATILREWEKK